VITGRMAQLYIVSMLWKVKPQFAVEQHTRLCFGVLALNYCFFCESSHSVQTKF
jgi:hypothetical protein